MNWLIETRVDTNANRIMYLTIASIGDAIPTPISIRIQFNLKWLDPSGDSAPEVIYAKLNVAFVNLLLDDKLSDVIVGCWCCRRDDMGLQHKTDAIVWPKSARWIISQLHRYGAWHLIDNFGNETQINRCCNESNWLWGSLQPQGLSLFTARSSRPVTAFKLINIPYWFISRKIVYTLSLS